MYAIASSSIILVQVIGSPPPPPHLLFPLSQNNMGKLISILIPEKSNDFKAIIIRFQGMVYIDSRDIILHKFYQELLRSIVMHCFYYYKSCNSVSI